MIEPANSLLGRLAGINRAELRKKEKPQSKGKTLVQRLEGFERNSAFFEKYRQVGRLVLPSRKGRPRGGLGASPTGRRSGPAGGWRVPCNRYVRTTVKARSQQS